MSRRRSTRWRGLRVEWRGWKYALVLDRDRDQEVKVYYRLGRWRYFSDDEPVRDQALIACARRLLKADAEGVTT